MKIGRPFLAALALVAVVAPAARAIDVTDERVVPEDRLARTVDVEDVTVRDGTVSGTIVNRTGNTLRDVRLVIRHLWLWNNEMHPGTDDPSRAEYYTVPGEIPPNGRQAFTYRPSTPLPEGRAGRFETDVRVASVVEVERGERSPTAGTSTRPATPDESDVGAPVRRPAPAEPDTGY
jgi:hypothetical protein